MPVQNGGFGWKSSPVGAAKVAVKPFKSAIGFVDWHTAVIASGAAVGSKRQERIAHKALVHVERVLSDHLHTSQANLKFLVRLRLYSGWHSGRTPSDYLQGITKVVGTYASKPRSYHDNRVVFASGHEGIQLGNRLAFVSERIVPKLGVHFLDTLRFRNRIPIEKMADTALAIDLLGLASRKAADQYIVLSDDDDMLPGLFAAAAGANAKMLSRPGKSSRFMAHARDLIDTYESVPP